MSSSTTTWTRASFNEYAENLAKRKKLHLQQEGLACITLWSGKSIVKDEPIYELLFFSSTKSVTVSQRGTVLKDLP